MKVVMTSNPYRDRNFKHVEQAAEILREVGVETKICLPFDVDKNFELPEKFTMQGLYDIHVEMSHSPQIVDGKRLEIYEVRYRIYQNNGSFRDDIYPDDTRTLVFGVEVYDDEAKISAIAHRAEG